VIGPASATDNAIVRFDGITGALVQNSVGILSDVGALSGITSLAMGGALSGVTTLAASGVVTISAGSVSAPAVIPSGDTNTGVYFPAADTVAIAAGGVRAINLNTVASGVNYLDVTPSATTANITLAAAGTDASIGITIAPKLNGNLFLNLSQLIQIGGTSASFPSITRDGVKINVGRASDGAMVSGCGVAANDFTTAATGQNVRISNDGFGVVVVSSTGQLGMSSTAAGVGVGTGPAVGIGYIAAKVCKVTDGSTGHGWLQWAGQSFLAADATNATATMAATGLTVNVTTGRKYTFRATLLLSESVSVDGMKLDFDASTAAATNFRCHGFATESASGPVDLGITTALATDITESVFGDGKVVLEGSFEPSSTGTFAIRFAQVAHTTGTLTLYRGSSLLCWDM
jgi:hypothetical protein